MTDTFTPFTIPAVELAAVALAQSNDETRYCLCGVFFTPRAMVATDGHVLTCAALEHDPSRPSVIMHISKKAITALRGRKALSARFDGATLTVLDEAEQPLYMEPSVPINGIENDGSTHYPDWIRVLPAKDAKLAPTGAAFGTAVLAVLIETGKILSGSRVGCALTFRAKDAGSAHLVRYRCDLGESVFSVAMPMRAEGNKPESYPAFMAGIWPA